MLQGGHIKTKTAIRNAQAPHIERPEDGSTPSTARLDSPVPPPSHFFCPQPVSPQLIQKRAKRKSPLAEEITTLRVHLLRLCITSEELAGMVGVKKGTLRGAISNGVPASRMRAKIEHALGVPIWTPPDEFTRRCARAKRFGFVAEGATLNQLTAHGKKLGVPGITTYRRNADCIAAIEAFLRSKTTTTKPN